MTLHDWTHYFRSNQKTRLKVPPETYDLTPAERRRITKSIQSFQLGESSEGNILRLQARQQSEQTGEPEYLEAIEHLIREENWHSAYLAQFMRRHKIPRFKRGFNDTVFRFLRRLAGVELSCRVLVTAEVIAMTYYDCLAVATNSPVLNLICRKMCEEEKAHVDFQMFQIHRINLQKHALSGSLADIFHFLLTSFTLVPVWWEHRRVLQVKYSGFQFAAKVWRDFQNAMADGQTQAAQSLIRAGLLRPEVLCT